MDDELDMILKQWMRSNQCAIPVFAWRDIQKQRKTSVSIASAPTEIRTKTLPNTSLERYLHTNRPKTILQVFRGYPFPISVGTLTIQTQIFWFPSASPGTRWATISNWVTTASFHILSNPPFINHPYVI
jgi:hypothetical protein